MRTDRTSLVDLGLLPDASGTWPLATWLDQTHAPAGHEALKRLIAEPLEHLEAIRARQVLLPQLASIATQVPWADLYARAMQVERFLTSNYVVVPSARTRRLLSMAQYREIAVHIAAQLRAVEALLALCQSLHARLLSLPDDAATLAMVSMVGAAVRHAQRERVRAAVDRGSHEVLLAVDAAVSGDMPSNRSTESRSEVNASMRSALEALIGAIPRLDALCSLATASANASGTVPRMVPPTGGALSFDNLRHPLLPRGVANDVHLDDGDRVLFLTGPNMAGTREVRMLREPPVQYWIGMYVARLGRVNDAAAALRALERVMVPGNQVHVANRGLLTAEIATARGQAHRALPALGETLRDGWSPIDLETVAWTALQAEDTATEREQARVILGWDVPLGSEGWLAQERTRGWSQRLAGETRR